MTGDEVGRLVVRLLGDSSAYKKMMDEAQSITRQASTAMDSRLRDSHGRFVKLQSDARQELSRTGLAFHKLGSAAGHFGMQMSKAGLLGAAGVATFAAGVAVSAVKIAAQAEQIQVAFEVMTGSAEVARDLVADLRKMGASTPFQTVDLLEATKVLLNFGRSSKDARQDLELLSNVASGDANKLRSLALVFGQVASAEKLMGQDLLQLINTGFNPLQTIAQRTGESMATLKDRMSKGRVSFDEVRLAFIDATSAGGRFFNMNERQSKTLLGRWSTLKDEIDAALLEIGESIMENMDLTEVTKNIAEMANQFKKEFVPAIQEFVRLAPDMVKALAQIGAGIGAVTKYAATGVSNLQKWAFLITSISSGVSPQDTAQNYIDQFMPELRKKKVTMQGAVEITPAQGDLHELLKKAFPKSLEKIKAKADEPMLQAEQEAFRMMSRLVEDGIENVREFAKQFKAASPEAEKLIDRLKEESELFGKSAKEIDLYTAAKDGALDSQLKLIASLHDEISAKEKAKEATDKAREAEKRFRDSFKTGGISGVGRGLDAMARLEEARNLRAGGMKQKENMMHGVSTQDQGLLKFKEASPTLKASINSEVQAKFDKRAGQELWEKALEKSNEFLKQISEDMKKQADKETVTLKPAGLGGGT